MSCVSSLKSSLTFSTFKATLINILIYFISITVDHMTMGNRSLNVMKLWRISQDFPPKKKLFQQPQVPAPPSGRGKYDRSKGRSQDVIERQCSRREEAGGGIVNKTLDFSMRAASCFMFQTDTFSHIFLEHIIGFVP